MFLIFLSASFPARNTWIFYVFLWYCLRGMMPPVTENLFQTLLFAYQSPVRNRKVSRQSRVKQEVSQVTRWTKTWYKVTFYVLAMNIFQGLSFSSDCVRGRPTLKSLFSALKPDLAPRKHERKKRETEGSRLKRRRNHRAPRKPW